MNLTNQAADPEEVMLSQGQLVKRGDTLDVLGDMSPSVIFAQGFGNVEPSYLEDSQVLLDRGRVFQPRFADRAAHTKDSP
ncbi:hypothetical protein ACOM2C_06095 [Pseudarthrobacter sp. So.54]